MLENKIDAYLNSGIYPMHTPGHKRNAAFINSGVFNRDITEIPGFDDLHDMRGILAETAALGAKLFGAEVSFPLVNGSTGGILAAVRSVSKKGGALVYSKYSHRSVRNAAELCGLKSIIYTPRCDGVSGVTGSVMPCAIEKLLLENQNACAVVITSPTYEGVISDIKSIAEIVHKNGLPLIVDAAHGAHFGFGNEPQNAVRSGADIEIVSLHKTLPCLTQASLLLSKNERAGTLQRELRVFQTSSPSYLLLASIDRCLRLLDDSSHLLFEKYVEIKGKINEKLENLNLLFRVNNSDAFHAYDDSKIVISTLKCDITGGKLSEELRVRGFECEASSDSHILAITTVADVPDALLRFADAVADIDSKLSPAKKLPRVIISPGVFRDAL